MSCVAFSRYGEESEPCWERTADLYWDIVDSDEVNAATLCHMNESGANRSLKSGRSRRFTRFLRYRLQQF